MKFKPSRLVAAVVLTVVTAAGQATFGTLAAQGDLAFSHGKFADAQRAYLEALEQSKETPEAASHQPAILNSLAIIYKLEGHYSEAESLCLRAVTMVQTSSGKTSPMLVPVLADLESLYASRNRFSEAEVTGRRALKIAAKDLSGSDAAARAELATGQALAGQNRFEAVLPYFEHALAIHERAQGPESIQYTWALQQYARFLRKAKRSAEASLIETRANECSTELDKKWMCPNSPGIEHIAKA